MSIITWRRSSRRKFYNLVLKLQGREETRKMVEELYKTASEEVSKVIEATEKGIDDETQTSEKTTEQTSQQPQQVIDPIRMVTKGRKRPTYYLIYTLF